MLRILVTLTSLLVLGACGGGGSTTPPPPPPGNTDAGVPLGTTNALNSAAVGATMVESAVQLALAAANPIIDIIQDDLLTLTVACGSGGAVTITITDRDASAVLSTGDAVSIDWQDDCFSGELNAVANGTISVEILDYWKGDSGQLFFTANVSFVDFQISDSASSTTNATFRLELILRHSNIELIQIHVENSQTIRIEVPSIGADERVTRALIRRELTGVAGTSDRPYTLDADLGISSALLDGDLSCITQRTLTSPNAAHEPLAGEFLCTGAKQSQVRINSDRVDRDAPIVVEVDSTGAGSFVAITDDLGNSIFWRDLVEGGLFTSRLRILSSGVLPDAPILTPLIEQLAINDMEYAAGVNKLYATTNTSLVEIDPENLQVLRTLDIAGSPGAIGIADDESAVWVALDDLSRLMKIDLITMTAGTSFALGDSTVAGFGPRDVYRIRVAPGSTDLVVISTPNAVEIVAYNNGMQLPEIIDELDTTFSPPRLFLFTSPTEIVAQDNISTAYSIFRIALDAMNGLTLTADIPFLSDQSRNRLKLGSQYVYASAGAVFDAANESLITNVGQNGYFYDDLDVDVSSGILVAMSSSSSNKYFDMIDEKNYRLLGHYRLPAITPNTRIEPVILTAASLVFKQGDELKRIDRAKLVANLPVDSCTRLDLSGILVSGTYLSLDCGFTAVTYDPARERLYAATDTRNANGNSIAVIDVATMQVTSYIPLNGLPGSLALSADGASLFVAIENSSRYVEIDLNSNTIANEVPLGTGARGPYTPNSIAAARGPDGELVISMNSDMALFGDSAQIGITASQNRRYSDIYLSADGSNAWGHDANNLDQYQVSSNGMIELQSFRNMIYPRAAAVRGDTIYSTDGRFFDMSSNLASVGCDDSSVSGILGTRVGADHLSTQLFYSWVNYLPATGNRMQVVSCNGDTLQSGPASNTYMFASLPGEGLVSVTPLSRDRIAVLGEKKLYILDRP